MITWIKAIEEIKKGPMKIVLFLFCAGQLLRCIIANNDMVKEIEHNG